MTREEAIKLIEHISVAFVPTDQYGDYDDPQPYEEALDMAIEALQNNGFCPNCGVVVRCKDCKHWKIDSHCDGYRSAEDFCSWGERREP